MSRHVISTGMSSVMEVAVERSSKIAFKRWRTGELSFGGCMWVESSTWSRLGVQGDAGEGGIDCVSPGFRGSKRVKTPSLAGFDLDPS